jgi:hypothetical protein
MAMGALVDVHSTPWHSFAPNSYDCSPLSLEAQQRTFQFTHPSTGVGRAEEKLLKKNAAPAPHGSKVRAFGRTSRTDGSRAGVRTERGLLGVDERSRCCCFCRKFTQNRTNQGNLRKANCGPRSQ